VRCEDISISQSFMRNKYRLKNIMRKKHLTQPARGPFHHRTPSKLFQRLVRSMLPRKTTRGTEALNRLKVREGIPVPFALKKRCVCPAALRVIRLAPGRRWCRLGDLCKDIGWKHDQTVQELEAKRKHKSALRWNKKKQLTRLREAAIAVVDKIVPKINFGDSKIKIGIDLFWGLKTDLGRDAATRRSPGPSAYPWAFNACLNGVDAPVRPRHVA